MKFRLSEILIALVIVGGVVAGSLYFFGNSPAPTDLPNENEATPHNTVKPTTAKTRPNAPAPTAGKLKRNPAIKTNSQGTEVLTKGKTSQRPLFPGDASTAEMQIDVIRQKFVSPDPVIRADAFHSIGGRTDRLPLEEVKDMFMSGVIDGDEDVRSAAVEATGRYTDAPDIITVYDKVLQTENEEDKNKVIQNIFNMTYSPEVEQTLARTLFDKDENIRELAYNILNLQNKGKFDSLEDAQEAFKNITKGGL